MRCLRRVLLPLLTILVLTNCNPTSLITTEPLPSTTSLRGQSAPTISTIVVGASTQPASSTTDPTLTQPPQPVSTPGARRFRIEQRVTGTQDALKPIAMILHTVAFTGTRLVLRVGFENTTDKGYDLFGGATGKDATLSDATGQDYHPMSVSPNLSTSIAPPDGWQPGGANVGDLIFPIPTAASPFIFKFPGYQPVTVRLDNPLVDAPPVALPAGTYPLTQTLYSTRDQLTNIELRMQSMAVDGEKLTFTIGFANTARQGYDLVVGPKGTDARLLDAEGTSYAPTRVSDSIKEKIAPKGGWQPNQVYTGTLTFLKPLVGDTFRFTFPEYTALSLHFDVHGITEANVTTPQGGTPAPRPTAGIEDLTFAQVQQLVADQAAALQTGNTDRYTASFAAPLQAEQRKIAIRIKQVPLVTYTLELSPKASLSGAATGTLVRIPVDAIFTLRDITAGNVFKNELLYTFGRTGDRWQVTAIDSSDNPPFWYVDDVVVRSTPHFLIIARPVSQAILPALEKETEAAYAELQARKLPLEEHYVAYFAGSESDFAQLTGKSANRYLGVALSRYEWSSDTITTLSRAFYINGAAFVNSQQQHTTNDRRVTIAHELVHLVLAKETRPFTPPWLVEGVAVYYSEGDTPAVRQRLLSDPNLSAISLAKLTNATSLGEHDLLGTTTGYEYAFSGETIAYLVQTFGEETMLAFYRSYAGVPAAEVRDKMPAFGGASVLDSAMADFSAKITPDAVQKFFGLSLDLLDHDVKAWLHP